MHDSNCSEANTQPPYPSLKPATRDWLVARSAAVLVHADIGAGSRATTEARAHPARNSAP